MGTSDMDVTDVSHSSRNLIMRESKPLDIREKNVLAIEKAGGKGPEARQSSVSFRFSKTTDVA